MDSRPSRGPMRSKVLGLGRATWRGPHGAGPWPNIQPFGPPASGLAGGSSCFQGSLRMGAVICPRPGGLRGGRLGVSARPPSSPPKACPGGSRVTSRMVLYNDGHVPRRRACLKKKIWRQLIWDLPVLGSRSVPSGERNGLLGLIAGAVCLSIKICLDCGRECCRSRS